MSALKFLGQILASVVYTSIFTGIMYLVIVFPLAYIISLPWWGILLVMMFFGGLIQGLIHILAGSGMLPYMWIVNKNIVATIISVVLILINVGSNMIRVWSAIGGGGSWAFIFGLAVSVLLIEFIVMSIFGITAIYSESKTK